MAPSVSFNTNYLDSYLFASNYKPVHTNTSSLSDAQIVVLPECHFSEDDQMRNAWIINTLYKEGDVVLVESPRDESETFHQIDKVSRKITIHGWDCAESDEALHRAKEPFYNLKDRLSQSKGLGAEHEQIFLNAIKAGPCRTDEAFRKQFTNRLNVLRCLPPDVRKVLLLREIEVWHEQNGELGRVLASTFGARQESLIRKCQQFSQADNRIFIVTGAAHAILDRSGQQWATNGVKLLHNYLKEKRFVVLDNLRSPTKLLRTDIKLGLMVSSIQKKITQVCGRVSAFFLLFLVLFTFPISLPCYMRYARSR